MPADNINHLLKSIDHLKVSKGNEYDLIDDDGGNNFFKPKSKAEVLKILDVAEKQFADGEFIDSEVMEKELAEEFGLKV